MNQKQQKDKRARWICTTQRTAAAAAVAACFSSVILIDEVRANPVNPTVVHGTASFAQSGNILNITNSPNAIINWGSFSIGVNELTRFIQQSGSSAVLNRVIGQDPSAILGSLQSNGRVFIINPNGIVFGANAQINVAGLVASTLNLSNDDFLSNRMKFTDGAGAGSVVNQGSITGGSVYLIGKAVSNDGLITSPNGEVILAAGNSVELVNPGTPNLRVEITAPDNEAKNLGTVTADAGRIGIYAGLVSNSGTLRADSAVVEGGRIVLKATKNVHLAAASQTSASGTTGGRVDIQAGDTTIVEGEIAATGRSGAGGTVQVLGNLVGLNGQASIDASGDTGGGTVLVGGDFQGKNPDIQNAFRTYVGQNVTINADAITSGDGGKVIVWADDITRYYGDISARGGANSGDGGFAEVSGKHSLDFRGTANLSAAKGVTGTLLLDPDYIDIQSFGFDALLPVTGGVGFGFADLGAYGGFVTIDPAVINAATANVILQANEDINVNNAISMNTAGVGIRMQAGGFLNVQAPITTKGGAITLVAGDAGSLTSPNEGALYVNAALNTTNTVPAGANITLAAPISDVGGNSVYINANINAGTGGMVDISGQRLDQVGGSITANLMDVMMTSAGNGDIKLTGSHTINDVTLVADRDISIAGPITKISAGASSFYAEAGRDIEILAGANISSTGGPWSITLFTDSGGADNGAIFINNAILNSAGGNISLTGGNGYAAGSAAYALGVTLSNGAQVLGGNGNITIEGQGAPGISNRDGVRVDSGSTVSGSGLVTIIGTGGTGSSSDNVGVRINNATVQSSGSNVVLIGQGGAGSSNNNGIRIDGAALVSAAGSVVLDGTGGGGTSDNSGIKIGNATVQSTGGGLVMLTGQGGAGSADNNDGVRLENAAVISTTGNVTVDGAGGTGGNDTVGIKLVSGSTIQSTSGVISLVGQGGSGVDNNHGVRLEGAALITSGGAISVIGNAAGSGNDNTGVKLAGGTVQATGTGNVTVSGQGSAGINDNEGIRIETGGAILAADGSINLNGSGGGSGTNNEGIDIAGAVSNTGPGTVVINGVGAAGAPAIVLKTGSALSSASGMTFGNGFDWSGGTIGGSGILSTPSGAVTNVTAAVALAPGKTWNNSGTVNISGSGVVDLGDFTPAVFNNQAGGVVNIASSAGWSFISDPSTQVGQINNAGTINVNNSTSWEAAFNNVASGVLNIAPSQFVSMQNGQNIAGNVSIGSGGFLWVSEWHGTDTFFNNTIISGTGTLQVLGSGPVAKFTNVSAPSATLKLGGGGTVQILNGASVFGALDAAGFGSGFGITNGEFQLASGDLIVPSNASYSGVVSYVAQAGDVIVPGLVNASYGGDITLSANTGSIKVLGGGSVLGDSVHLLGNNEVIIGETSSSLPASVQANTLLEIVTAGSFKLLGGSGPGAYAAASSSGMVTVNASGDVILAGGSGAGSFAHLLGDPDVALQVGGVIRLDAGMGLGSYAAIESVSSVTIQADFPNLASGGYFVNGVEGAVYDAATGTGFIAGGSPAVLNSNLIVTYGLTAPPGGSIVPPVVEETIETPSQNLIVALNESTEPPEAEKEKDVFKESEDDKKKDAPVCK